jgi:hypothetical protein
MNSWYQSAINREFTQFSSSLSVSPRAGTSETSNLTLFDEVLENEFGSVLQTLQFKINMLNRYEIIKLLGKGSYGRVYLARRKSDGHLWVIKQVSLDGISEQEKEETLNEVSIPFNQVFLLIQFP